MADENKQEENQEENKDLINKGVEGDKTMDIQTAGEITEGDEEQDETITESEDEETKPYRTFETEEEYQEFIAEERKKLQELKEEKPEKKLDEDVDKFFDDDWKPENWNDYTRALLSNPKVKEFVSKNYAGDIQAEINNLSEAERQELVSINKTFDKQYDDLAKQGLVPERSTQEGKVIDQQISLIGATYGQSDMTKAYELWKKIPKTEGGGLDYESPKKQKISEQKRKSGKIGSKRSGTKSGETKVVSYEDIHTRSLDEIVQDALDE